MTDRPRRATVEPMHWEERLLALFDDLEQQAEGLALSARDAEVAELGRAEYAQVDLASRLHGSVGRRVGLVVEGLGRLDAVLARVGAEWCLADERLPVLLHLRGGGTVRGTVRRVGADFVELLAGLPDGAWADAASARPEVVAFGAVAAVRRT